MDDTTQPSTTITPTPATSDGSTTTEGIDMTTPMNVFMPPATDSGSASSLPMAMLAGMGGTGHGGIAGAGAGLGAGLVGGILGGLLFGGGRGGLWGGNGDGNHNFNAGNAPLTVDMATTQTMGLMNSIATVKDTVTTGQQMLTNTVSGGFAAQNTNTLQQTIMLIQQLNAQNLATMNTLNTINQNVSEQGCATRSAVNADGTVTRSLITSINDQNLNRMLGTAEAALMDANRRHDHAAVIAQITNTNTAVAAQAQGQQQQQQQQIVGTLQSIIPALNNITQIAHATNQNIIAGNTGAVTTAAQTASPTNVNT